jgi:hypothetical protein
MEIDGVFAVSAIGLSVAAFVNADIGNNDKELEMSGDDARAIYEALDVREELYALNRPTVKTVKSVGDLECSMTKRLDDISYSCTFNDNSSSAASFDSSRDIYRSLRAFPYPVDSEENSDAVIQRKTAGPLECDKVTFPPTEIVSYSCTIK